jgi:hypothetical protein
VVTESDRPMLLRTFELLLGLPNGFLVLEDGVTNRSLTLAEAEVVRLLNKEFKRQKWPDSSYARFMRYGAIEQMKAARQPSSGEAKIVTPDWALERAAEIGAEMTLRGGRPERRRTAVSRSITFVTSPRCNGRHGTL